MKDGSLRHRLTRARVVETLAALAIIAVGLMFLSIVHSQERPYGSPGDIGSAAFFPGLISLLVSALGIVHLLLIWSRPRGDGYQPKEGSWRAMGVYAGMLALMSSLNVLGIWLVAMLAVPLLAVCFGERRWLVLLILAVLPPAVVIHVFEAGMGIYFPRGVLL